MGGGEGGELAGEGQNLHAVYAAGGQQSLLLIQRGEQAELAGILLQNRPRMRPKCDHNGLLSPFPGSGDHRLKDMTVPKMDTVKKTCGYYSHFTHSKA